MSEVTTIAPAAEAVFSLLDRQLELWEKHWSEQVAKQAVWLSGLVDFEKAEEILEEVSQIAISDSSVWRRAQHWGERFRGMEATERARANALPGRGETPCRGVKKEGRMGVAMDGSMVHIREEGRKELEIGCVFGVEVRPMLDGGTGDMVELGHAVDNSYVAHPSGLSPSGRSLGGPKIFGQTFVSLSGLDLERFG